MPSRPMITEDSSSEDGRPHSVTRRTALAGAISVGSLPLLGGCVSIRQDRAAETITRSIPTEAVSDLEISNGDGDVVVEHRPGETVELRARKRARGAVSLDDLSIVVGVTAERLRVETEIEDQDVFGDGWIDLRVEIPSDVSLTAVEASDGDVTLDEVSGDVTVDGADGAIFARAHEGSLAINNVDGDVTVRDAAGTVGATVVDGNVHVSDPADLDSLDVTDGHITADLSALRGDTSVEATDGDIVLRLAPDLDVQIEATTIDGAVIGESVVDDVDFATESAMEGRLGVGSATLSLHATDGDITLRRGG